MRADAMNACAIDNFKTRVCYDWLLMPNFLHAFYFYYSYLSFMYLFIRLFIIQINDVYILQQCHFILYI